MKTLTEGRSFTIHEGNALWTFAQSRKGKVSGFSKEVGIGRTKLYEYFEMQHLPDEIVNTILQKMKMPYIELFVQSVRKEEDVRIIRRTRDTTKEWRTNQHGNRFEPLTDGTWRVHHKHVGIAAHAAYAAGWGDDEYTDALPDRTAIVNEYSDNLFISFTVVGECQDDNTIDGIVPGMEVTCESVPRSMWKYTLPFEPPAAKRLKVKAGNKEIILPEKEKRYRFWVLNNRLKGIQIVTIKNHDTEKGILHCACRNPDRVMYPDFTVDISVCSQIFHVIRRTLNY